jgi:AraC-like DNA-binding protein
MDLDAIRDLPMPATYGRHLMRLFAPEQLLRGTGLAQADLDDPVRRITVRQALQYIDNAIRLAPRPEWYLEWALGIVEHFQGPISIALVSAPTLGESLDAFIRYFPARVPYLDLRGRADGEEFCAELHSLIDLGASRPLLLETPLVILQQYLLHVYGVDLGAARIELDYAPTSYAERYGAFMRCPVRFDARRSALVIPRAWRAIPNLGYVGATWAHAMQQCETTLGSSSARDTLCALSAYLGSAFEVAHRERALPTLNQAAARLHLAPRTLIRRLRRLGTTYQTITDDFLRARACELLGNEQLKIKEVAGALGFSNPANFGKAFKRWVGMSPGRYRVRDRAAGPPARER